MPKKISKSWVDTFVSNNAWPILGIIITIAVSYTTITTRVNAQDDRIEKLENALVEIAQNQKDIIVLQQQYLAVGENIKDIKKILGAP